MDVPSEQNSFDELLSHLRKQEDRIAKIESYLHITSQEEENKEVEPHILHTRDSKSDDLLEFKIGQFWFAKLGILVFMVGLIFLLTFPYHNLPPFLPSFFGYIFAVSLMITAKKFLSQFGYISGYLKGGGIALLYFSTMRLHFFTSQQVISNLTFETLLLMIITGLSIYIGLKSNSSYLTALSLTEGYITALLNGNAYFIFSVLLLLSIAFLYLKLHYKWDVLLLYGVLLTYSAHLLWFINNPLLGNAVRFNYVPQINSIFLLGYMIVFTLGYVINRQNKNEEFLEIFNTSIILSLSYGLFLAITVGESGPSFTILNIFASVIFLSFAILFWIRIKSKYSTFLFAMFGYLALSAAIINQFPSPDFFIWLCWQSLLVVSTALWFKSKFITIANFFIYLLVFILYVVLNGKLNSVSISYGIVALLSARILNWKKERLELKTELMRNGYLIMGLFIIPYALYHSLPEGWVSVSWVIVALLYYLLSVVLKSKKYRWMALATLLLTIGYIFVFGISRLEATYKIISFLLLGVVLLIISLIYAKTKVKYFSKNN